MTESSGGAGSTATRERTAARPAPAAGGRGRGRGRGIGRVSLYYREVVAEMRKVIWPSRRDLITYTTVVLVFVSVMVAIVALLDFVFGKGVLAVFGG